MLSCVYDPLGLGAPFMLKGRHHSAIIPREVGVG